jgi:type 1 glutamine amidotransferase
MTHQLTRLLGLLTLLFAAAGVARSQSTDFHVLAFYSTTVEQDHLDFAQQAIPFFQDLAKRKGFTFEATTDWNRLAQADLPRYQVVVWLDDVPSNAAQRAGFEKYMEHGGGWLGFHIAGYLDRRVDWPWFADFLGSVFSGNSWPPMPATIDVDDTDSKSYPTDGMPKQFVSPANEWYCWEPSPRKSPNIHVLMTLDAKNFPLGFKDTLTGGDVPVTWTNTKYRMLYTNMGHGAKIFENPQQNAFFARALLWLGEGAH